jgi:uncharacterized protein (TIGR02246 family)
MRELYEQLLTAWNRRDVEAYASLFAPDALVVGFDGSQIRGAEIVGHLGPIFADHPTGRYVAKVRAIREVGDQAVLLWAIAGMVPPGKEDLNPDVDAVQTVVAERRGDGWAIVLFQNTPAQYHGRPELAAEHRRELLPALLDGVTVLGD